MGDLGYAVRLVPPDCVKPFVKRQKCDMADAGAIAEPALRPNMLSSKNLYEAAADTSATSAHKGRSSRA